VTDHLHHQRLDKCPFHVAFHAPQRIQRVEIVSRPRVRQLDTTRMEWAGGLAKLALQLRM
jgi:hypothetical protein